MLDDRTANLMGITPLSELEAEEQRLLFAQRQVDETIAAARIEEARKHATAEAKAQSDDGKAYSMHEVPGLGRYIIPRISGWKTLLGIVHDPVPNIDFSANIYPAFDGVIGQRFQSPYLLDPLDNKYESYESLRDNLAAVRNFLMERYFAVDSTMDPTIAKQNMNEIANFVGDGLYNNFLFGGIIPNHNPDLPHIDLKRARAKDGEGAQYIYDCILAHNRHTSGFRPLDAIKELFGGQKAPNWQLPDSHKTHFTEMFHKDLEKNLPHPQVDATVDPAAAIAAAYANGKAIEARLDAVRDAKLLSNQASDLDNVGDYLIYSASHMNGVAQMDAAKRRTAVDIAKDILKGLKIFGDKDATKALGFLPSEDAAVFGSLKSVAKVYDRLTAWARANGDTNILQNPAVLMATQALAQIGYMAKQEALRLAQTAGNHLQASLIGEQIHLLPESYKPRPGTKFGDLLDTIQSGMETILNRTQEVSVDGGEIGHALDGNLGGVNTVPTAGMSGQGGVHNAAGRNTQAMIATELAAQAQAQQINAHMNDKARRQGQPTQAAPPRSSSGRQALGTARAASKQAAVVSSGRVNITAPLTASQMQAARANTSAGLAARRMSMGHHEDEHEHEIEQLRIAQQRAAAAKIQASALKLPAIKGFDMKGVTGAPIAAGRVPKPQDILANRAAAAKVQSGIAPQTVTTKSVDHSRDHPTRDDHHEVPQPVPPTRGGGRGF